MAELPNNLLTQISSLVHHPKLQKCYLLAQDYETAPPWGDNAIPLQYWPESLADSKGSEWTPKSIPGGSHPIYQWTQGGERSISFTSVFTTDTNPGDGLGEVSDSGKTYGAADVAYFGSVIGANVSSVTDAYDNNGIRGIHHGERDIDLRSIVSWLRWFTYPEYKGQGSSSRVYEPAKCVLIMPNTSLGYDGSDFVQCVMRGCNVTYQAWFPNGFPRILEVQLEFVEVVQSATRVQFHSRTDMGRAAVVKGSAK